MASYVSSRRSAQAGKKSPKFTKSRKNFHFLKLQQMKYISKVVNPNGIGNQRTPIFSQLDLRISIYLLSHPTWVAFVQTAHLILP